MTKVKKSGGDANTLNVQMTAGETEAQTMARALTAPYVRHGVVAQGLGTKMLGDLPGNPGINDYGQCIKTGAERAKAGDLTLATEMLVAQAISLDAMFTELARRATMNFGDYPLAAERYARLAFKAQSNSRAALEALAKLHQPREQIVRHVHVNEGGQAVIADEIHHHGGNGENGKFGKQSHATRAAGQCAALPSPDPLGNAVPVSSGEGQASVPNARGAQPRRAGGQ